MTTTTFDGASVFALIIGIDKYMKVGEGGFNPLNGAVHDAEEFEKFLLAPRSEGGLEVPPSHIKVLKNTQAKRAAILSNFQSHFLDNRDIPDHGEAAMIFFFAGHGSRIEAPSNQLSNDRLVEAICPVDERTIAETCVQRVVNRFVGRDADANYVYAIPDYVLRYLLQQLSDKKGNNITVILDSCHSGGMYRTDSTEADSQVGRFRQAEKSSRLIPPTLDNHLWKDRPDMSYSVWEPTAASHVLLAACAQGQKAYESWVRPFGGFFTTELVKALRNAVLNNTTYDTLIRGLKLNGQTPLCSGENSDRLIFKTSYTAAGRQALPLLLDPGENSFSVPMGSVEGIGSQAEFSIIYPVCTLVARTVTNDKTIVAFKDGVPAVDIREGSLAIVKGYTNDRQALPLLPGPSKNSFSVSVGSVEGIRSGTEFSIIYPVCTLVARTVKINETMVAFKDGEPAVDIPAGSWAVVKDFKNPSLILGVYTPPDFAYTSDLFSSNDPTHVRRYAQERFRDTADIALRSEGGGLVVERRSGLISNLEHAREAHFDLKKDKDGKTIHLPSVLDGIAHFHYFLEQNNGKVLWNDGTVPGPAFSLEMYRLQGIFPTHSPVDPENGNMINSGKVFFRSDPKAEYGFTIRNTSGEDLFPYLFYFDPDSYQIQCWYSPEDAHARAPLVRTEGKKNVGIGGERPRSFAFPPKDKSHSNDRKSSGFIKLFVSTEYLDLTWIKQTTSPFDPKFQGLGRLTAFQNAIPKEAKWNAIEVLLTMVEE